MPNADEKSKNVLSEKELVVITLKTVAFTLACLFIAIPLMFGFLVSVSPRFAYDVYDYLNVYEGQFENSEILYLKARKKSNSMDNSTEQSSYNQEFLWPYQVMMMDSGIVLMDDYYSLVMEYYDLNYAAKRTGDFTAARKYEKQYNKYLKKAKYYAAKLERVIYDFTYYNNTQAFARDLDINNMRKTIFRDQLFVTNYLGHLNAKRTKALYILGYVWKRDIETDRRGEDFAEEYALIVNWGVFYNSLYTTETETESKRLKTISEIRDDPNIIINQSAAVYLNCLLDMIGYRGSSTPVSAKTVGMYDPVVFENSIINPLYEDSFDYIVQLKTLAEHYYIKLLSPASLQNSELMTGMQIARMIYEFSLAIHCIYRSYNTYAGNKGLAQNTERVSYWVRTVSDWSDILRDLINFYVNENKS